MSKHGTAGVRAVEQSIAIAAPVDAVWKALTDAEEMTRWFPLEAGQNADGTLWMGWRDQFRFAGRVEAIEPMRYMRSVPVFPPGQEPPVRMATEITLETREGTSVVRIVQSGFLADAAWDEEFDGTRRGWGFQLRGLKLYLERHRGTPRHVAWARAMRAIPAEDAWQRLLASDGLVRDGSLTDLRPGDRFRFGSADGHVFEGEVHALQPGKDLIGIVESWNHALVRIQLDDLPLRGYRDVNLWLSTYGVDVNRVRALEAGWHAMLARLFPGPTARS